MISICTSILNEADNLEVFVRSLVGNATDKNFEIVVVDDENSCKSKLEELQREFPQIKRATRSKIDKARFAEGLIKMYRVNHIFESELIDEMEQTLADFRSSKINLWLPSAHNFNLAAQYARGDRLVFMPADYLIFFDLSEVIDGHFDWIDVTSVEPYPDFSVLKDMKSVGEFKSFTEEILAEAYNQKVATIQQQHGARVVSKQRFEDLGGFDERWFIRAIGDDLFNYKNGVSRMVDAIGHLTSPYIGAIRGTSNKEFKYLSPRYSINYDDHKFFFDRIDKWRMANE